MSDEGYFTGYNFTFRERCRALRKAMTRQEKHLWYDFLRNYPVKFYRQRPIDWYIADFYCSKAHLIIEVDGNQHFKRDKKEYDKIRTDILEAYHLEVLRFTNQEIDTQFESVCRVIDESVLGGHAHPLPPL